MDPVTSGSTTERIVRTSLITAMAIGAAGWCLYDAKVGYPMENLKRATSGLTPAPELSGDLISPAVTQAAGAALTPGGFLKGLVEQFGDPGWRGPVEAGMSEVRFFGPAGQIIATVNVGDMVSAVRFEPAKYKREADLVSQMWMGIIVGVIAGLLVLHWLRVMLVRATMTDEGIKFTGRALIPFEAMTELHPETYARKGWVEISYEIDGRSGRLRLDDYKIKTFPLMIAETCRRKGWEDPHQKWQEQKKAASAQ